MSYQLLTISGDLFPVIIGEGICLSLNFQGLNVLLKLKYLKSSFLISKVYVKNVKTSYP